MENGKKISINENNKQTKNTYKNPLSLTVVRIYVVCYVVKLL